jgi:hypothetical protein
LIPGGRGIKRTALHMRERVSTVRLKCAFVHRDAVRAVPRYPHGKVSSCDIIGRSGFPTRTLARQDFRAAFSLCLSFNKS